MSSSTILYYDPVVAFDRLFEDTPAARFYPRRAGGLSTTARQTLNYRGVYRPRLDVHESKETNTVTATFELPGMTPDRVTIEIQQDRLTVSGNGPQSPAGASGAGADPRQGSEEGSYVVRERVHFDGKFSRTLRLPVGTKPEDVKAKMERGVLTITFPRASPDEPPTRIAIQ